MSSVDFDVRDNNDANLPVEVIWINMKTINYPNYEVSSSGNVRSTFARKGVKKNLAVHWDRFKNAYINLYPPRTGGAKSQSQSISLCDVVATIFVPNPNKKPLILHINGDLSDNRACNLKWVNSFTPDDRIETWKSLDFMGYPNYAVSDLGHVKNVMTNRIHMCTKDNLGYIKAGLVNVNGSNDQLHIHILVATAFSPNPENKPLVDHKDRVRDNNCVDNLRWVTYSENKLNSSQSRKFTPAIYQMSLDGEIIRKWDSVRMASDALGIPYKTMYNYCNDNAKSKDFIWRYCMDVDPIPVDEIWKPVVLPGVENLEASSYGRLRRGSNSRPTFGSLSGSYLTITIFNTHTEVRQTQYAHRLVANAFYGPSDLVVNHISGDKLDNKIENLEYVTRLENLNHAIKTGLRKTYKTGQYTLKRELIRVYNSVAEASEITGISKDSIKRTCRGAQRTGMGFIWKYEQ